MSDAEARSFLARGAPTGKVATISEDGAPHVTPIWFALDDGGDLLFTTSAESRTGRNLRRDPRVSLCVDDERPPFSFVRVDGTVAISDDLDEMLPWTVRIASRYMGPDLGQPYGRRNAVTGEVLVRVRPVRIDGVGDVAE